MSDTISGDVQDEVQSDESRGSDRGSAQQKNDRVITLVGQGNGPDGERMVFRLHKDRVVVGSVISADVRLVGQGVSPIHAVVELEGSDPDQAVIYDLASDTGIFVNGSKAITQVIRSGDKVKIGPYELQFNIEDLAEVARRSRTRESEGRRLFLNPGEDLAPLLLEDESKAQPIFDYRPAQKKALEVVMSWRGTILDVEHFVKEKAVTIGTSRKSDFGIPTELGGASAPRYPFVVRQGESFSLNLDAQMKGVIQSRGQLVTLDEARGKASQIDLSLEDFAKISIGEVDFYLSFTAAPPRLKIGRMVDRDPFFFRIFLASLAFSGAAIGTLLHVNVPQNIEAEQIPERIATILYQPEKYVSQKPKEIIQPTPPQKTEPVQEAQPPKVEPKPQVTAKVEINPSHKPKDKPIPKEMQVGKQTSKAQPKAPPKPVGGPPKSQSEAKEGEGAKAKGDSGIRGQKNAPKSGVHQDEASRPAPQGGEGKGAGDSQVQDDGNVDFLKSATGKIENILGNSAAQLGKGGEKLKGFGGFTTQGNGGLALSGGGKGGGGEADSLGGLGKKGTGGGLVGTGKGAAGTGTGIIGGKARVAIKTGGPEEAVVMGSIDADAIEAAMMAHRDRFRRCYEQEINAENPNLAGRVGTTFVIGSTGKVTQAGIASTTLHNANAERCILNVIRSIDFPIPRGAGVVQVSYPFKFNAVGK